MERLKQAFIAARNALAALNELAGKTEVTMIERDAAILRFEFTFEAVWKAARAFLSC